MEEAKPYLMAFVVMAIYAGMSIIAKLAFNHGMNALIFVFYRMAFASLSLAPFAFSQRKKAPPLSYKIVGKSFILAFIGMALSQNLYSTGLNYTTPTVASAVSNSVPAMTFLLAVLLRMETLKPQSLVGAMKLLAIALCVAGVATIALYTGPTWQLMIQQLHISKYDSIYVDDKHSWIQGTLMVISGNITWSLWLVMQGKLLVNYPSKLLLTTMQCLFSMMQSFIIAISFERDLSKWKLKFDVDLISVLYSGVVVTGIGFYLQSWVIESKGPVFFAAFVPLNMTLTILISVFVMKQPISLGSVLGGVLLIGCLYGFLWGKSKEQKDLYLPINDGRDLVEESQHDEEEQIRH